MPGEGRGADTSKRHKHAEKKEEERGGGEVPIKPCCVVNGNGTCVSVPIRPGIDGKWAHAPLHIS